MILIIDNYDSFTYNLAQIIGQQTNDIRVIRNDKITINEISEMHLQGIVISPGPGRPENAGICVEVIKTLGPTIPTLGVCLGHQAIGYAFGAKIIHAPLLMHGKTSKIFHYHNPLFNNLPNPFEATRYHSLIVKSTLPPELEITAATGDNIIMGIRHTTYPIQGIQFHPESVLTKVGSQLLSNWLKTLPPQS